MCWNNLVFRNPGWSLTTWFPNLFDPPPPCLDPQVGKPGLTTLMMIYQIWLPKVIYFVVASCPFLSLAMLGCPCYCWKEFHWRHSQLCMPYLSNSVQWLQRETQCLHLIIARVTLECNQLTTFILKGRGLWVGKTFNPTIVVSSFALSIILITQPA